MGVLAGPLLFSIFKIYFYIYNNNLFLYNNSSLSVSYTHTGYIRSFFIFLLFLFLNLLWLLWCPLYTSHYLYINVKKNGETVDGIVSNVVRTCVTSGEFRHTFRFNIIT